MELGVHFSLADTTVVVVHLQTLALPLAVAWLPLTAAVVVLNLLLLAAAGVHVVVFLVSLTAA